MTCTDWTAHCCSVRVGRCTARSETLIALHDPGVAQKSPRPPDFRSPAAAVELCSNGENHGRTLRWRPLSKPFFWMPKFDHIRVCSPGLKIMNIQDGVFRFPMNICFQKCSSRAFWVLAPVNFTWRPKIGFGRYFSQSQSRASSF